MAKKKVVEYDDEEGLEVEEKEVKEKPAKKKKDLLDCMIDGNALVNRPRMVIPVCPSVDVLLGGGVPEGSFVIATGKMKLGKTSWSLQLAARAQEERFGGREVYFYNIEGRLKKRDLEGIKGLKLSKPHFNLIESSQGNILSGEDFIEIGERLINEKPNAVHIFDSFSMLCTEARREGSMRDRFRDDTPLLLATFCKRISNVIPVNNSIVIGITHVMANQGGGPMAPKTTEASGTKIQYAVDVKMNALYKKEWSVGDVQIGHEIYWKCECSAIGGPGKAMSLFRYGYGFDKEAELVALGADYGLIEKGGSWYTFPDGTKAQGLENARNHLVEHPELFEKIYGELRSMLGIATTQ